jgi:hypothetical protein
MLVFACSWLTLKRRRSLVSASVVLVLASFALSCGGSGTSPSHTSVPGTPAGNYTATVSASSGGVSHSMQLTLVVQ